MDSWGRKSKACTRVETLLLSRGCRETLFRYMLGKLDIGYVRGIGCCWLLRERHVKMDALGRPRGNNDIAHVYILYFLFIDRAHGKLGDANQCNRPDPLCFIQAVALDRSPNSTRRKGSRLDADIDPRSHGDCTPEFSRSSIVRRRRDTHYRSGQKEPVKSIILC